jgi:hypothetical protein
MSGQKSEPPGGAIWLLRHLGRASRNEALTGDLIEEFREGRSPGWFWKQVLIAIAVGVLSEIRRHWPHFSYAIAGTAMPALLWTDNRAIPFGVHWSVLPWPWSQLAFELSTDALLALAALPVLAAALVINGSFRWVSLLRTGVINLALITFGHFLSDAFPWLLRPLAGNPYLWVSIFPWGFEPLLFFSNFLVSAWLGCLPPRNAGKLARQAGS